MSLDAWDYVSPLDIDREAERFAGAEPFRFIVVDDFLRPDFAREVCRAYPSYAEARKVSEREFRKVNEYNKVEITSKASFPEPVQRLSEALQSEALREALVRITGIQDLLADPEHRGAGMHLMDARSRLDLHVDFNHLDQRLYRRLNLILYLNEEWEEGWGGALDIWDPEVKRCEHVVAPVANRAVIFNTVPRSYHGVLPVTCPPGRSRNTFAVFYYTEARPPDWEGRYEGTLWAYRPGEEPRRYLLAGPERLARGLGRQLQRGKRALFGSKDRSGRG